MSLCFCVLHEFNNTMWSSQILHIAVNSGRHSLCYPNGFGFCVVALLLSCTIFMKGFHFATNLLWCLAVIINQGDHLSGKPGNVREFETCQGNVTGDNVNSQGNVREKILSGKCPKTVH